METVLTSCRVPWAISPTSSGVTLRWSEGEIEPKCMVAVGAGRLTTTGQLDRRRIEVEFDLCCYARCGPHDDRENIAAIGYRISPRYEGAIEHYLAWREKEWKEAGCCPDSGFYVAKTSMWLSGLPSFFHSGFRHYVLDGRDGYVELIARSFRWREWLWLDPSRGEPLSARAAVASGEGVA